MGQTSKGQHDAASISCNETESLVDISIERRRSFGNALEDNLCNIDEYMCVKRNELKAILDSNQMVMVVGPPGGGKSFFIDEYLETKKKHKHLSLHPSALSEGLWNIEETFLTNKSIHDQEMTLLFSGNFLLSAYPFPDKMLSNQTLYYLTGEPVRLHKNSKIIFKVTNSH